MVWSSLSDFGGDGRAVRGRLASGPAEGSSLRLLLAAGGDGGGENRSFATATVCLDDFSSANRLSGLRARRPCARRLHLARVLVDACNLCRRRHGTEMTRIAVDWNTLECRAGILPPFSYVAHMSDSVELYPMSGCFPQYVVVFYVESLTGRYCAIDAHVLHATTANSHRFAVHIPLPVHARACSECPDIPQPDVW